MSGPTATCARRRGRAARPQGDDRDHPDEWAAQLARSPTRSCAPSGLVSSAATTLVSSPDVPLVAATTLRRRDARARRRPSRPWRAPATSSSWPATSGPGKTAFAQGFGRGPRGGRADHQPHLHPRPRRTTAGSPLHHLDVYRLEQLSEALDLGLPEMLDEGGVALIEWGDAIIPAPARTTTSRSASPSGADDDDRYLAFDADRARRGGTRLGCGSTAAVRPMASDRDSRRPLMLILGIDDRHRAGGLRHRRPRGRAGVVHSHARPPPRRDPHAGDRVPLPARRASSLARSASSPSTSGPACSPGCASASPPARPSPTPCRVPMIGVPSLDLLAFPLRFTRRRIVAAHRRPAAASSSTPSTGRCPAACSASPSTRSARPTTSPSSCWPRGEECLLVGDGALRYREALRGAEQGRVRRRRAGPPLGRRRSCSSPTPRPCARSSCSPWDLTPAVPAQARRRDQLDRPATARPARGGRALRRDPADARRHDRCRCGAGTSAACCASSSRSTRGRGRSACS